MMKIYCDRCQKEITVWDEFLSDTLAKEYPNKNICVNCDTLIKLSEVAAKKDIENNWKPETALKKICKLYDIEIKE